MNGLLLSKLVLLCEYKLVQAGERVGFNSGFNLRVQPLLVGGYSLN